MYRYLGLYVGAANLGLPRQLYNVQRTTFYFCIELGANQTASDISHFSSRNTAHLRVTPTVYRTSSLSVGVCQFVHID